MKKADRIKRPKNVTGLLFQKKAKKTDITIPARKTDLIINNLLKQLPALLRINQL